MIGEARRIAMLQPPRRRVRAVIDTDAFNEVDDQFAIVQMLLASERIATEAIYAAPFHNARSTGPGHGMELSFAEILRLLQRLGRSPDGLVFRGVTEWVGPAKLAREAEAVDDLIRRARTATPDDPLYVVAIAAISNVASALLAAPDIAERIVVVWLGGHALDWADTREFNLAGDLGGAQVLLDCGVRVVLLPCYGVVSHLSVSVPEIERYVAPHGEIGRFLASRFKEPCLDPMGWSRTIWDMAAVAFLIEPDWCDSALVPTPILTDSFTWSFPRGRHAMRYVFRVRRDAIFRDFFARLAAFAG